MPGVHWPLCLFPWMIINTKNALGVVRSGLVTDMGYNREC